MNQMNPVDFTEDYLGGWCGGTLRARLTHRQTDKQPTNARVRTDPGSS